MYELSLQLPFNNFNIRGTLSLPVKSESLIIFSHFENSNIKIPVQKELALKFQQNGFGTLVFNLMGQQKVFIKTIEKQIDLFSQGLFSSINWLNNHSEYRPLDFAFLGASLGSDIVFKTTAMLESTVIKSIVSLSGHLEFVTEEELRNVRCPTLLAAGELDFPNVKKNKQVKNILKEPKHLSVIDDTHNLSEKNCPSKKLAEVASPWFRNHLTLSTQPVAF